VDLEGVLQRLLPLAGSVTSTPDPGRAAPPNGADSPIDQAVFARLADPAEGGDPAFQAEVIDLFLAESRPQLRQLQEALARGDATALRQVAHALKGICAQVGAHRLQSLCEQIEGVARSGPLADGPPLLARLATEYDRVCATL